ncbi:MAG: 16S rRNA (cytidine(1402)-2'-O)-methyltransferase [SAR324 cluster bacterium]|nr:16S rRNA (cytidine(1402)-2'-O)-methyltransferase [SAR324 cluster bacterium]
MNSSNSSNSGKLYLVSTHVGHPDDISKRAIDVLTQVDLVVCEERKNGSQLLKHLGIQKELFSLNEHNEAEESQGLIHQLRQGRTMALISDAGTPVFADPGTILVQQAIQQGIMIVPIPGASSLMAALVCSGFSLKSFYYAGFLPRNSQDRRHAIENLTNYHSVLVIYDTPYRLGALLKDLSHYFGNQNGVICCQLTYPDEKIYRGTVRKLSEQITKNPVKCEFVIIIDNIRHSGPKNRKFPKS